MSIIVTKSGKSAQKLEKSHFEHEGRLQSYIYDNPESLPLYEIREDIRLLILAREFPTGSGPIDAIGLDMDGEIYVIETKLYKNADKRFVVAQVLDYGASLWRRQIDFAAFMDILEVQSIKTHGVGARQRLAEFFSIQDDGVELLLVTARENLNHGKFRFVVLMDHLHDRLRDLIVFLNENSRFDLYAVELEYYKFEEYEIVIPKLFGSEVKKELGATTRNGNRKRWDEATFFEDAKQHLTADELQAIKEVYEFFNKTADEVSWGTGAVRGSFSPKFDAISDRSLISIYSDGTLTVNFGWLNDTKETEIFSQSLKDALVVKLNFTFDPKSDTKYPSFAKNEWIESAKGLMEVIEALVGKARDAR